MKFSTVVAAAAVSSVAFAAEDEPVTVTTTFHGSTDTHRYGRFDKTSKEPTATTSGTHRYGRFDKTSKEPTATTSGTHRYGRFDKTANPTTTTIFITNPSAVGFAAANGTANGTNGTSNGTAHKNGTNDSSSSADSGAAAASGAFLGFAGAVAAGLLLI